MLIFGNSRYEDMVSTLRAILYPEAEPVLKQVYDEIACVYTSVCTQASEIGVNSWLVYAVFVATFHRYLSLYGIILVQLILLKISFF